MINVLLLSLRTQLVDVGIQEIALHRMPPEDHLPSKLRSVKQAFYSGKNQKKWDYLFTFPRGRGIKGEGDK